MTTVQPVRANSGTFAGIARKKASLSAGVGACRMEFGENVTSERESDFLRPWALVPELRFEPGPQGEYNFQANCISGELTGLPQNFCSLGLESLDAALV